MWFQNPTVDPKISTTKLLPEITRLKLEESSDSNKGVEQDKTSEWCFSVPKTRSDTIIKGSLDEKLPSYELLNMLKETDQSSNSFVK